MPWYALVDADGRRLLEFDRIGRFFVDDPLPDNADEPELIEFICTGIGVPRDAPVDVTRVPGGEVVADIGAVQFLNVSGAYDITR